MNKTIIINSETLGKGSEELGGKLMGAFLRKLWVEEKKPEHIIFYNSGVKLLSKESGVLDALDGLFESGVDLIACGTCVEYYDLKDSIGTGRISGMEEIVSILMNAQDVVTV